MNVHYLKRPVSGRCPARIASLAVERQVTSGVVSADGGLIQFTGASLALTHFSKGKWSKPVKVNVRSTADLWQTLDGWGTRDHLTYVICPRAGDELTIAGYWDRLRAGQVRTMPSASASGNSGSGTGRTRRPRPEPLVLSQRSDVIGWRIGVKRFRAVSVTNWCPVSLRAAMLAVGMPVSTWPDVEFDWCDGRIATDRLAEACLKWVQKSIDWWRTSGGGLWRDTVGAMAWQSYLARVPKRTVVPHEIPAAVRLEALAAVGGRNEAWYRGNIGDPAAWPDVPGRPAPSDRNGRIECGVTRFDCRGLYPHLLGTMPYPIRLAGWQREFTVEKLRLALKHVGAVASVRIRTSRSEIPRTRRGAADYPIGDFDTVLAGPELRDALSRDEVQAVHHCCTYHLGHPFHDWSRWILEQRGKLKAEGDAAGEALAKSLAVALGGRLGARKYAWVHEPAVTPAVEWGEWFVMRTEDSEPSRYRSLCGIVQRESKCRFPTGLFAAQYAYLTAYARCHMRALRELCPLGTVIQQDTDCLTVRNDSAVAMEAMRANTGPDWGMFKVEGTFTAGRYWDARHYWLDGAYTLAGIGDGFCVRPDGVIDYVLTANPVRQSRDPSRHAVARLGREMRIDDMCKGARIDDDGWIVAPRVQTGATEPINPARPPDLFSPLPLS